MSTENTAEMNVSEATIAPETSSLAPETTPDQSHNQANHESDQYLPHSTVNELIRKQKNKAYQKGVEESSTQWQSELEKIRSELDSLKNGQTKLPETSSDSMASQATPNVRDMVNAELQRYQTAEAEKLQQLQAEEYIKNTMTQLAPKVQEAEKKYDDFNEATQAADFVNEAPELLFYANDVDNGGDVLYNLAKNPSKIGALKALSPRLAQLEIKKLSESLKQNESAKMGSHPRAPLAQAKPSNIGGDNGVHSLRDLKAKYARMV